MTYILHRAGTRMAVDSLKLQLAVALILSTDQADLDDDVSIEEASTLLQIIEFVTVLLLLIVEKNE